MDKCNIGVLTVNIEFMWLGMKRMERLIKARLSPVSKPHHINSIWTVKAAILYMNICSPFAAILDLTLICRTQL
jgi:hypothetical protein